MSETEKSSQLSLAEASRRLGVHTTTLRRWADAGAIPVYITPGGHRRFASSDIEALIARKPLGQQTLTSVWAARVLEQTRSELAHTPQRPAWLAPLAEEDRAAWRRVGQQLMGVVLRYVNNSDEDDALLNEARSIGDYYATLARRAGMPLSSAIEAALFFRDSLVEAAMDLPEESHVRAADSARLLRRISRAVNVVQLAVVAGYEDGDTVEG
jgi:excisionase family DNA binding protein